MISLGNLKCERTFLVVGHVESRGHWLKVVHTISSVWEECALTVALFPVGLGLVSYVWVYPKGPTHCCINHHWGWERGNKNPRLGLNPAITQRARRDVWLDSFNYSHHRSLTDPSPLHNDRFLSSFGEQSNKALHTCTFDILLFKKNKVQLDGSQRLFESVLHLSSH